jgi:DNA-binding response OmpR family regulator
MAYTIVLAEDEAHIARLTQFKLEKEGFTVVWKENGQAAFEAVQELKPDLVILDVMMPIMDGYEVLGKLKADATLKQIPVVMLTARGQERDVLRGLEMGSAEYIVKPFRPAELVARIRKLLEG